MYNQFVGKRQGTTVDANRSLHTVDVAGGGWSKTGDSSTTASDYAWTVCGHAALWCLVTICGT